MAIPRPCATQIETNPPPAALPNVNIYFLREINAAVNDYFLREIERIQVHEGEAGGEMVPEGGFEPPTKGL